jgi:hypothetical protein
MAATARKPRPLETLQARLCITWGTDHSCLVMSDYKSRKGMAHRRDLPFFVREFCPRPGKDRGYRAKKGRENEGKPGPEARGYKMDR